MSYNISGWGTISGQTLDNDGKVVPSIITAAYWFNGGHEDLGAQFAQGKPEGATIDGSSNRQLVSFNHEIDLDVATGQITINSSCRIFTFNDTSYMLSGGGLV